jgi:hypothetical protein
MEKIMATSERRIPPHLVLPEDMMSKLQKFEVVARENGFIEDSESQDGSTVWFRNAMADVGSVVHMRLCIDGLTNSATVFWETVPSKLHSITFRTVSALREWLTLGVGNHK